MKMRWRQKYLHGSVSNPETDGKSMASKKKKQDEKSVSSKKSKRFGNKQGEKGKPPRKPKWALSRPPPVQTFYKDGADDMPRISIELSMSELQEEALARGIERHYMPTKKADLLDFLVDGSIHLRKTKAWKDVERLKSKMEADCRRIEEEKSKDCANTASVSQSESDKFQTSDELKDALRDLDLPDPVTFSTTRDQSHISSIASTLPSRHVFQSYKRRDGSLSLRPEGSMSLQPDMSFQTQADDTAMGTLIRMIPGSFSCGIPVCSAKEIQRDLEGGSKTSDQRKEKELEEVIVRRNEQKEVRKKESKEMQQQMSTKWDASVQFEPWIVSPPQNNQESTGSMMKGFTVWCSISSDVLDHPPKQFDATYKNLGDANDRARYLFYWRNPWRLTPSKMVDLVLVKSDNSSNNECASTFHCVHPNGDKWIVSVVHDSTFKYLDNASAIRHPMDQD